MNYRNRKLVITIRTLLGLIFLASGIMGLLAGSSVEGIPESMVVITQSLWASGILQMIKVTEIVAGLMLISGFLPALAAIFVSPICVGIVIVNLRLAPNYIAAGIVVTLFTAYLGYAYWGKYKALFERN